MTANTTNNRPVEVRPLNENDLDNLVIYLNKLKPETVKRFGPHGFDKQSVSELFLATDQYKGYIAIDTETSEIVAYAVIKIGFLEHDSFRLQSYGITPDPVTDCTFAPSVADDWQSQGLGNLMFGFIVNDLKSIGIKRIILWGGVQGSNQRAVNYYLRNGFRNLGQFEYNGLNYDMILEKL
jgi:GNAT superfamily N-acetyltransferase